MSKKNNRRLFTKNTLIVLFVLFIITMTLSDKIERGLQNYRTEVFSKTEYYTLSGSQQEIFHKSVKDRNYSRSSLPLMASKLEDENLDISVNCKYEDNNRYVIHVDFEWQTDTNVNGDQFIIALNSEYWQSLEPIHCYLYSDSEDSKASSLEPDSAVFSGAGFDLSGKDIIRGQGVMIVTPTKEEVKKEILVGYVQNKLPIDTGISITLFNTPIDPVRARWEIIKF